MDAFLVLTQRAEKDWTGAMFSYIWEQASFISCSESVEL